MSLEFQAVVEVQVSVSVAVKGKCAVLNEVEESIKERAHREISTKLFVGKEAPFYDTTITVQRIKDRKIWAKVF